MSGIEVGTAFVRILPLVNQAEFAALLGTQVNAVTTASKVGAATQVAAQKTVAEATVAASAVRVTAERNYLREVLASSSTQKVAQRGVVAAAVAAAQTQVAAAGEVTAANVVTAESIGAVAASYKVSAAAAVQAAGVQRAAFLGQAGAVAAGSNVLGALGPRAAVTGEQAVTRAVSKGLVDVGSGANVARGALIGLSRITPVAVFGLGVMGTAAIGAGLALKSAVSSASEFQAQLNTFQAVTKATDEDMKQVSATALALGADLSLPATSANDAAVALTELSKAGLSVEDSLAAAKGVLQLATIAGISAGDAAVIAATQLNAFALAGDQAARVTELLADASIAAQGEITDFAAGFAQAGTAAKQSGVSIEDTTALLTQLGLAGIKGADGGTSLRTFLLRLVPTTKEASQYTKALGIELDKNRSIGSQLPDVIEQYRKQLLLLNPQQQTLVLNQIFGQDAFRAASVIFSQQKDALRALTDEFERTNSTQDLSKAKAEGLSGAVGSLKSQFETAGTQVGLVASGPLEAFVRGLSHTFDNIGKVSGALADLERQHDIVKKVSVVFDVTVPSFLVPGSGEGQDLGSFLTSGLKYFFLPTLVNKIIDEAIPDKKEVLGPPVPEGYGEKPIGRRNFRTPTEAEIAYNSVEGRRARARIAQQQADAAAANQAIKGIPIPKGLQQAQVDAQIDNSLKAELSADNAILKYLEKKRDRLVKGTKAYLAASKQVEAAQAQRDSVQAEITGNSEAAAAERQRRSNEAIAADKEAAAAAAANAKASIDLQNARLDARLAAAQGTKTNVDNKAVYNAMIAFNQLQINTLRAEEVGLKRTSLAYKEKETAVQGLIKANANLRQSIKGLTDTSAAGGGFSLQDLFKESLRQFQEFGSNVSSNPLSPGQVRGQFAGTLLTTILGSQKDRAALGITTVASNTSETNLLLRQLIALMKGDPIPSGTGQVTSISVGRVTADSGRRLHRNVGHL